MKKIFFALSFVACMMPTLSQAQTEVTAIVRAKEIRADRSQIRLDLRASYNKAVAANRPCITEFIGCTSQVGDAECRNKTVLARRTLRVGKRIDIFAFVPPVDGSENKQTQLNIQVVSRCQVGRVGERLLTSGAAAANVTCETGLTPAKFVRAVRAEFLQ